MTWLRILLRQAEPCASAPLADVLPVQGVLKVRRVLPSNPAEGTAPSQLPLGFGRYRVFDAPRGDVPGGPTHQPGVMPGHGYEALRTPFGETGTPGDGRERNVTDLDLAANRHPTVSNRLG